MSTIQQPSEEREKVFKQLKQRHDEIYSVIAEKFPDLTPFDLGFFSAFTLTKMGPVFEDPNAQQFFVQLTRYFVTLQLEMSKKPEGESPNKHMAKKVTLFDAKGDKIE